MWAAFQFVICMQNGVLSVHLSGSQKGGSWVVLNWNCRENGGEQIEHADCCMSSDGQCLVGQ